ncbi:hypothetical protein ASG82_18740 [Mycobacterium sp. Soil538]|nr:hypothetical protein ASG82_18740 [Mycobacterium sp. Soil538]
MTVSTVPEVVARMQEIAAHTPPADGAHVFNDVYLQVTRQIGERLGAGEFFRDEPFMSDMTVRFASLWFDAYDAGDRPPAAWEPLFAMRARSGVLPIQFALAGMNAHIEHDLPIAVIRTCIAHGRNPTSPGLREDYDRVNQLLAAAEGEIRRSFLTELEQAVDDHLSLVAHLVSSWSIEKARDVAWVTVQTLWELRGLKHLYNAYADGLAHTVGMGSRLLLTSID